VRDALLGAQQRHDFAQGIELEPEPFFIHSDTATR
jgi:hypothetical protein